MMATGSAANGLSYLMVAHWDDLHEIIAKPPSTNMTSSTSVAINRPKYPFSRSRPTSVSSPANSGKQQALSWPIGLGAKVRDVFLFILEYQYDIFKKKKTRRKSFNPLQMY